MSASHFFKHTRIHGHLLFMSDCLLVLINCQKSLLLAASTNYNGYPSLYLIHVEIRYLQIKIVTCKRCLLDFEQSKHEFNGRAHLLKCLKLRDLLLFKILQIILFVGCYSMSVNATSVKINSLTKAIMSATCVALLNFGTFAQR